MTDSKDHTEEKARFFRSLEKGDFATFTVVLGAHPEWKDATGPAKSVRFNKHAPAIVIAAELGLEEAVKSLISVGADFSARGALGGTALHWAAWFGFAGIVEALLQAGADTLDDATEWHCAPLFWAVHGFSYRGDCLRRDQLQSAKLLLKAGAPPNPTNNEGTTALSLLTEPEDREMISLLIKGENLREDDRSAG